MRLCGLSIPYEYQHHEKVASNRIHNAATTTNDPICYDNLDIAGALNSIAADAQGIWKAMKQSYFFDIEIKPIDAATVKEELNILSVDLEKIAEVVQSTLKSEAGQERWPEEVPLVHFRHISIPDKIKTLTEMSKQFKTFAEKLPESWENNDSYCNFFHKTRFL